MARHKSAQKRARQSERRRLRNREVRSRLRTVVKAFLASIASGSQDAGERLRAAEAALRRAASKGVIPELRASRTVSRLARRLASAPRSS